MCVCVCVCVRKRERGRERKLIMTHIILKTADISSLSPTLLATPTPPLHVALSSENLTLSVCVQEGGLLKCYFYDTRALSQGKVQA